MSVQYRRLPLFHPGEAYRCNDFLLPEFSLSYRFDTFLSFAHQFCSSFVHRFFLQSFRVDHADSSSGLLLCLDPFCLSLSFVCLFSVGFSSTIVPCEWTRYVWKYLCLLHRAEWPRQGWVDSRPCRVFRLPWWENLRERCLENDKALQSTTVWRFYPECPRPMVHHLASKLWYSLLRRSVLRARATQREKRTSRTALTSAMGLSSFCSSSSLNTRVNCSKLDGQRTMLLTHQVRRVSRCIRDQFSSSSSQRSILVNDRGI